MFYMKRQTVLIAQAGFSASALSAVSQPLRRHIGIYDQTHLKHLQACPLYFYAPHVFVWDMSSLKCSKCWFHMKEQLGRKQQPEQRRATVSYFTLCTFSVAFQKFPPSFTGQRMLISSCSNQHLCGLGLQVSSINSVSICKNVSVKLSKFQLCLSFLPAGLCTGIK